jgi:hypothetical protein
MFQGNILEFELIFKIGSIVCAYGGRQKNTSRAPRWTGLLYIIQLKFILYNCKKIRTISVCVFALNSKGKKKYILNVLYIKYVIYNFKILLSYF